MSAKQQAFRMFMSMRTEICLLHDSELLKDKIAKQCALIAVDELIKQEISLLGLGENYIPTWYNWVKHEIELL